MIEIFISLESAILAGFKNVFIFILASLLPKLRLVLSPRFRQKITKNRHILLFNIYDLCKYQVNRIKIDEVMRITKFTVYIFGAEYNSNYFHIHLI